MSQQQPGRGSNQRQPGVYYLACISLGSIAGAAIAAALGGFGIGTVIGNLGIGIASGAGVGMAIGLALKDRG